MERIDLAIKQGTEDEKLVKSEIESQRKKRRRTVDWLTATVLAVHLPNFFIYFKNCLKQIKKLKNI